MAQRRNEPGVAEASRRVLPRGGDPLTWSVPVARIGSVTIRLHAVLLATILVVLVRAAWYTGDEAFFLGPRPAFILLGSMVVVVTIHELATAWVVRRLGGAMPEVVLQPLGGLDDGLPPPGWRRAVVSALVGPGLALALSATAAVVLLIFTDGAMRPRPFSPFSGLFAPAIAASPWLEGVYIFGAVSAIVAGANLLPTPPFRGRILLEALLRPQMGTNAARRATHTIAVTVTVVILVVGLVGLWLPPVLVALMCGAALWREREQTRVRRAVVVGDHWPPEPELPDPLDGQDSLFDLRSDAIMEQQDAEESEREREGEEIEVDRILRKIAAEGIDALDSREREILRRATDRRRGDP